MPTDNTSSGSLMWQDENGNWHHLGKMQDIKSISEPDGAPILYATSLCGSEEVIIRGAISEEAEATLWAAAEGLEIVKKENNDGN